MFRELLTDLTNTDNLIACIILNNTSIRKSRQMRMVEIGTNAITLLGRDSVPFPSADGCRNFLDELLNLTCFTAAKAIEDSPSSIIS